jgi:kynureninase
VGAKILLDVYQSAGIVPLDLSSLGVDAAVGGCLKWLCGGPGNAFLYVRPDLIPELEPALTGWQAHRAPFEFALGPNSFSDAGAVRFLTGTPNIPAHRAAEAGIEILARAGVERVRAHNVALTERILERAEREGWRTYTPRAAAERGGSVSVHPPQAYEISRVLLERNVVIDFRLGTGIRLGPHFYNTAEEVEAALDCMAEALASGEWKRYAGRARDFVT